MTPGRPLRVRVLGPLEVEGMDELALGSRKARTLVRVLALARGRPVPAEVIAERLWPQDAPARPSEQVAVLVSRLRRVLGADRLPRTDAGYALRTDWLDIDALDELVDEASRRLSSGGYASARTAAAAALALLRGPLLADEPDAEWAEAERASAARLASSVRRTAAEAALATGDAAAAGDLASRALDEDPFDEGALRIVMAAHVASGRPAAAIAAYEVMRERLADELGVDPAPATRTAHAAVVTGEPVHGFAGAASAAPSHAGDGGELPGRDGELGALDRALEQTSHGRGLRFVVLEGEAGIGKTRVLDAMSVRAEAAGFVLLRGRCDELGRDLPLQVLVDALESRLRALGPQAADALLGEDASALAPLLGRGPGTSPSDAATGKAILFGALLAVIERMASAAPVALILDDLHLAGPSTLEWLHFAHRRGTDARVLVAGARRSEEGGAVPADETIELGPLPLEAAAVLVGAERAASLHERSGGHPLFLAELAAADADALPASIREAVAARCERAGAAAPTLRIAAVLGPEVDLDLIAGVLHRPVSELLDHLEEGVHRYFLVERGTSFVFRHELVREALEGGTSASRRAHAHREAGRILSARPGADPLVVAYHARLGGNAALASEALVGAAVIAADRYDYAEAERMLDEAIALHDSPGARVARAQTRMLDARYAAAAEDASLAVSQGAGAVALEVAGWAAYFMRDFDAAVRFADDGARLATDDEIRASCLTLSGRILLALGHVGDADVRLAEAMSLSRGAALGMASASLALLRAQQGRPEESLEVCRAGAVARRSFRGHPQARAYAGLASAHSLFSVGRAADALEALDAIDLDLDRIQGGRYRPRVDNYRAWILRGLGDVERADDLNRSARDAHVAAEPEAYALLDLAHGCLLRGDAASGLALLHGLEPLAKIETVGRWRWLLKARLLSGDLALASGDCEEALTSALDVADESARLGIRRFAAAAALLEARARLRAGDAIDVAPVDDVLRNYAELCLPEAWLVAAQLAAAARHEPWWSVADGVVARIAKDAAGYEDSFVRYAGTVLDRIKISGE